MVGGHKDAAGSATHCVQEEGHFQGAVQQALEVPVPLDLWVKRGDRERQQGRQRSGEDLQGPASLPRNGQPQSPAQQSWSLSPRPASTVDKRKAHQAHPPLTAGSRAGLTGLCPHPLCVVKQEREEPISQRTTENLRG